MIQNTNIDVWVADDDASDLPSFMGEKEPNEPPAPPSAAMLIAARNEAGLDQEAAAQLIFRSPEEWDRWERGRSRMDLWLWQLWQLRARRARENRLSGAGQTMTTQVRDPGKTG